MSELLKYARIRDDEEFRLRVAAAMQLRVEEMRAWDLTPRTKALIDWVDDHPLEAPDKMLAACVVNPTIAQNVEMDGLAIRTDLVPDDDIKFVVADQWEAVGARLFPNIVALPAE